MTSKTLLIFAISGLSIQIACSGKNEGRPEIAGSPIPVSTRTVDYASIASVVEVPGTVQPRSRISLASQINGFVREMRVRAGDPVRKDQILATLDARDAESQAAVARAAVQEAEASLSEARKSHQAAVEMHQAAKASAALAGQTFTRYQKLAESRSVTPQELDEVRSRRDAGIAELASREAMVAAAEQRIKQVEARISQARAQTGRADVMLSWTEIKAPVPGRVVQRLADPGTAIFPGSPLLIIESTEKPQVVADIPNEHAGLLRPGGTVRLRGEDTETTIEGRVTEIIPLSDPATHSIQFKVDLPPTVSMHSGQFVKVDVPAGTRDALLAPKTAVRQTGQLTGLFVVEAGSKAGFRLVKIAPYDAERVEVLSGVNPGEKIITGLSPQIVDGIPVTER